MSSRASPGLLAMTIAAAPSHRPLGLVIATWVARAFLALVFLGAGTSKLAGEPAMVTMFDQIGAGQWTRYLVGTLELAGAVGVLVPRLSALAATGLVLLMVGATITNLAVLDDPPWLTLTLLVVAAFVAWAGWRRVARPPHVP